MYLGGERKAACVAESRAALSRRVDRRPENESGDDQSAEQSALHEPLTGGRPSVGTRKPRTIALTGAHVGIRKWKLPIVEPTCWIPDSGPMPVSTATQPTLCPIPDLVGEMGPPQ